MIMGDMKHLDAYKAQMPDFIYEVLKEASQFDFAGVPDGKYKIKGCNMNVETSPTEPSAQRKLEGHKEFIDVQYEVEGKEEWIGIETIFDAGKCIETRTETFIFMKQEKIRKRKSISRRAVLLYSSRKIFTVLSAREAKRDLLSEKLLSRFRLTESEKHFSYSD